MLVYLYFERDAIKNIYNKKYLQLRMCKMGLYIKEIRFKKKKEVYQFESVRFLLHFLFYYFYYIYRQRQ